MPAPTVSSYALVSGRRVARKLYRCDGQTPKCVHTIRPGDVYLEAVAFPGHDAVGGTKPQRHRDCAPCALWFTDLDADARLDPIPFEQLARQGLL